MLLLHSTLSVWLRWLRQKFILTSVRKPRRRARPTFEKLEPRIQLNADPASPENWFNNYDYDVDDNGTIDGRDAAAYTALGFGGGGKVFDYNRCPDINGDGARNHHDWEDLIAAIQEIDPFYPYSSSPVFPLDYTYGDYAYAEEPSDSEYGDYWNNGDPYYGELDDDWPEYYGEPSYEDPDYSDPYSVDPYQPPEDPVDYFNGEPDSNNNQPSYTNDPYFDDPYPTDPYFNEPYSGDPGFEDPWGEEPGFVDWIDTSNYPPPSYPGLGDDGSYDSAPSPWTNGSHPNGVEEGGWSQDEEAIAFGAEESDTEEVEESKENGGGGGGAEDEEGNRRGYNNVYNEPWGSPISADLDDGLALDAVEDGVWTRYALSLEIPIRNNDTIHTSENFLHTTEIRAYDNSFETFPILNGKNGEWAYWFEKLEGTSTFRTLETEAVSTVTFGGFHFSEDLGDYPYSVNGGESTTNMRWAIWTGGWVSINNTYGETKLNNLYFIGGVINDKSPAVGKYGDATGMIISESGGFQMVLPSFDGRQSSQTVDGDGLLCFTAPPVFAIEQSPTHGNAELRENKVNYTPYPGAYGEDQFTYSITTQLGDVDTATVYLGSFDLRIHHRSGDHFGENDESTTGVLLPLNDDDDNRTSKPDYADTIAENGGQHDDDLTMLSIAVYAPPELKGDGSYVLRFDSRIVRLWWTPNKTPGPNGLEYIVPGEAYPLSGSDREIYFWAEGVSQGSSAVQAEFHFQGIASYDLSDSVLIHVIDADLEIDSNNDDGLSPPERSAWEEYLEDSEYAIGKLVYQDANDYTPIELYITPGLDLWMMNKDFEIRLNYEVTGKSGVVKLWTHSKYDWMRKDELVKLGGSVLQPNTRYTLNQLNYDSATGRIRLFLETLIAHEDHSTKKGIDDSGKPTQKIQANISWDGVLLGTDTIRYMCVIQNTFYPHLQTREELRNSFASSLVYGQMEDKRYGLRLLEGEELVRLEIPDDIRKLIGTPESVPGFKSGLYLDYLSGKYILAFAGTDDAHDIMVDIQQGLGKFTDQYATALEIGRYLPTNGNLAERTLITGHSLGGGLASIASIGSGYHADTFNAAGLTEETLYFDFFGNPRAPIPHELERYRFLSASLIDAYYVDCDLLSFVQDRTPLPSAIGNRVLLTGPLEPNVRLLIWTLGAELLPTGDWLAFLVTLGPLVDDMVECHKMDAVFYGLMVNKSAGWDIYGYA